MKNLLIFTLVLLICSASAFGQSNELVGTFSVVSATGSDPSPIVTGNFNSTVGFLPSAVDTNDFMVVRQVFAGSHRRKLYRITGTSGNSPLTLTLSLVSGTTGGPFPPGTQEIVRRTAKGALLDVPNVSQELESYTYNYNAQHFEDADVDTTYVRNDSTFVALNDGTEYFTGKGTAGAITSFQVGDSVYIVYNPDTIFTGVAYNNAGIDTVYLSGGNYYMVTTENDTFLIGAAAQVTLNGAHPVNPPTYLMHVDTLGVDTVYFDNNGVWARFNVGGTSIGSPFFTTNNNFVTFFPVGIPPIGSFVWNLDQGALYRKFTPTSYFSITEPNGRLVKSIDRYYQIDNLTGWDLNLNATAQVGVINNDTCTISAPANMSTLGRGGTRTVLVQSDYASSPIVAIFDTFYVDQNWDYLGSVVVPVHREVIFEFSIVSIDSLGVRMMLISPDNATTGTTYVFSDSANGLDLNESAGTVTVAPDITELVYAAVVGADSVMMWDASANVHRRTSVADIVALASAGTVTVTDQANGLDITLTGSDITIAPDITELANTTVAATDSVMVWDSDINQHRRVSAASIAALNTAAVTGINELANGIDVTLSGGLIGVAYDINELTNLPTAAADDSLLIWDTSANQYKSVSSYGVGAGLWVDLSTNQTNIAGVKGFVTTLQYGSGAMPTACGIGASTETTAFFKGGTGTINETNLQDALGLAIKTEVNSGTGYQTTILAATGNDAGQDGSDIVLRCRPNGIGQNWINVAKFRGDGATLFKAASGVSAGDANVGLGGIAFDNGGANYVLRSQVNNVATLNLTENGNTTARIDQGFDGWLAGSDSILKHDIVQLVPTLAQIRAFKSYSYRLNRSDSLMVGVIAQDLTSIPGVVFGEEGVDTLAVSPLAVAALALGATAKLQAQIDSLVTGRGMDTLVAANDLTVSYTRDFFIVTGNTQINAITTAGRRAGSEITFLFTGTPTVKHATVGAGGTAPLRLSGSVDLVAAANSMLVVKYDGTVFQEKSRKTP